MGLLSVAIHCGMALRPWQNPRTSTPCRTSTSKDETLTVAHGNVVETRVVVALPEKVAVPFRFEFNLADDWR